MSEQLLVDGEDMITFVKRGSFNFEEHLYSQIDSLTFTLKDYDDLNPIPQLSRTSGAHVAWILADGTRRFGGRVVRSNRFRGADGLTEYRMLAQDYTVMLHNEASPTARSAFINKTYTGRTSAQIIHDAATLLGLDLDVTTYVVTGATHERIQANRLTFAQLLDTLIQEDRGGETYNEELQGQIWNYYVDSGPGPNGEIAALHYFEEKLGDAPYIAASNPLRVLGDERQAWQITHDRGTSLSGIISGLTSGQTYDFQVRGTNSIGNGLWSESVTLTIP